MALIFFIMDMIQQINVNNLAEYDSIVDFIETNQLS